MKKFIFILATISILFASCTKDGSIKGIVLNSLNNEPLANVAIIATSSINIEEDKKYEQIYAQANSNGEFLLKGVSEKYDYTISIQSPGYISEEIKNVRVTEKGKTLILDKSLNGFKRPDGIGLYIFDKSSGQWISIAISGEMKTIEFYSKGGAKISFPVIPSTSGLNTVTVNSLSENYEPVTDWIEGVETNKAPIENSQIINSDTYICYVGYQRGIHLANLFLYPKMTIYDVRGEAGYPGTFELPEGYYPCARIRGKGLCCRYLGLEMESGLDFTFYDIFSKAIGDVLYGSLHLTPNQYYIFYGNDGAQYSIIQTK